MQLRFWVVLGDFELIVVNLSRSSMIPLFLLLSMSSMRDH